MSFLQLFKQSTPFPHLRKPIISDLIRKREIWTSYWWTEHIYRRHTAFYKKAHKLAEKAAPRLGITPHLAVYKILYDALKSIEPTIRFEHRELEPQQSRWLERDGYGGFKETWGSILKR